MRQHDDPFMRPENAVLIQGDTYRVKEELKALGACWDPQMAGWWVPTARAAEARNLVDNCEGQMSFEEALWTNGVAVPLDESSTEPLSRNG
jgi:hypothetical protein